MSRSLKETIQEINSRYAAALSQPGAPGSGAFFTEDADLLPPGPDNLKGTQAIEAFWAAVTEHYHQVRLTTVDVAPLGSDAVREIGTYWAAAKAAGVIRSAASTCSSGAKSARIGRFGPTSGLRTKGRHSHQPQGTAQLSHL